MSKETNAKKKHRIFRDIRFWCGAVFLTMAAGCTTSVQDFAAASFNRVKAPPRPANAPTGSAFINATAKLGPDAREDAIYREIKRGNVPSFIWQLKPVRLSSQYKGKRHQGRIWVTPDYLAIGSDADFVRMPMTPKTAQRLADAYGCMLPTRKLVDLIYEQASVKLKPESMRPSPRMVTNAAYAQHNQMVNRQFGRRSRNQLVAGHKKDVVFTNRLKLRPNRVAIYGWHVNPRKPIQPLSLFHIASYADYSHGIRFVNQWMEVDGKATRVADVLRNPELAGLLSDEGRMATTRVALAFAADEMM